MINVKKLDGSKTSVCSAIKGKDGLVIEDLEQRFLQGYPDREANNNQGGKACGRYKQLLVDV